jgi:cytoskeletal protein RodZ
MVRMQRRFMLFSIWLLATLVTGGLAWSAVAVAGNRTVGDGPVRPLSAAEVAALPGSTAPAPSAALDERRGSTTTDAGAERPGPSATPAATSTNPSTTTPAIPAATTASATTTVAQTAASTASTGTPSTSTSTSNASSTQPFAYHLVGGSIGIDLNGDRVTLSWATPNSGFHTEIKSDGPEMVVVEFEGEDHESKITVTVVDGQPRPEMHEEGEEHDGDHD